MFNKEFLKTLTVLYVEDDVKIRTSLSNILVKVFKKVIICDDGNEGLLKYKYHTHEENIKIDIILSDINMPNMNGIEMVQDIRELNQDIPIIFTTAHGESNYLMEAINLKIAYYALKPVNTAELLDNISKFCMIEHNKKQLVMQSKQIMQYMDIINTITSIFKVNKEGVIIEANELICDVLEYSNEELLGSHVDSMLDKDTIVKTFKDTLSLIDQHELFKGKLKFISKLGNTIYFNSTIITIKDEYKQEIEGYLYICMDQTDDEIEKQQTMQRVRKNMIQQRTKESHLLKTAKELEEELDRVKFNSVSHEDSQVILNTLSKEKQKVVALNHQISRYEKEIVKLNKHKNKIDDGDKNKRIVQMKKRENDSNEKEKLQSKIIELQSLLSKQEAKNKPKSVK